MIDFGRECTLNTNWTGSVRLMLANAHYEAARELPDEDSQRAYWSRPNVWPDIQFAFEQFFKLYPEAGGYRHNYLRYAGWCGQWQVILNQAKLFTSTNHAFFGGEWAFNGMIQTAVAQTKKD